MSLNQLCAQRFKVGDLYYIVLPDKTNEVQVAAPYYGYSFGPSIVNIPSSVKYKGFTYAVTRIRDYAFGGNYGLTSVTIPESITSIGDKAFVECKFLRSVTIPKNVKSIGRQAFWFSGLRSIKILSSETRIGDFAFWNCKNLTSVSLPEDIFNIGRGAFDHTPWLASCPDGCVYVRAALYTYKGLMPVNTSIIIRDGTKEISDCAFNRKRLNIYIGIEEEQVSDEDDSPQCIGLISVTIPKSLTRIGDDAFIGCINLMSIDIPKSVTSIGNDAFQGTPWLANKPNGCVYIGSVLYKYKGVMPINTSIAVREGTIEISGGAFNAYYDSYYNLINPHSTTNLISITLPKTLTHIGVNTFFGCTGLTSITLPKNITSIQRSAFKDCTGLNSITIPNSVNTLGDYAFSGCASLTSVAIPSSLNNQINRAFMDTPWLKKRRESRTTSCR